MLVDASIDRRGVLPVSEKPDARTDRRGVLSVCDTPDVRTDRGGVTSLSFDDPDSLFADDAISPSNVPKATQTNSEIGENVEKRKNRYMKNAI